MNKKFLLTVALMISFYKISFAQGGFTSETLTGIIIAVAAIVGIAALITITDNLMKVEASKLGLDVVKNDIGIFPSLESLFSGKAKHLTGDDSGYHILKKGHDIKLSGKPKKEIVTKNTTRIAISPYDFRGMSPIPKVTVEVGDNVKAGDPVFFDKKVPDVIYTAPVSGEIIEINRGDKRSIKSIVILADKNTGFKKFDTDSSTSDQIKKTMAESGAWTLINQRPYDVVPSLDGVARDIFISTFDSAPLAPDNSLILFGSEEHFQKGVDILAKLTSGSVYLGLDANDKKNPFSNISNVQRHWFKGKHPAGNVGVQIHNIKPIKPGQTVWTLGVQDVIIIGKLFNEGIMDYSRIIATGGSRIINPVHIKTQTGANIGELLKEQIKASEKAARIIDGDVLSGVQKGENDYLGFKADQISVISEGDDYELFGWLLPIKPRPSISNTFPNFLYPDYEFEGETNTHGEKRAFVVTGQYEEVLPMDIYPQHLMKAIMAEDLEKMEGLGINELSEEDVALCEFVCTSKSPLQTTLRKGLDFVKEQG
jgi:Na+-transporting NADH:ubiquinone oxidoreductase subunit A